MSAPRKTINGRTFAFGTIPAEASFEVEHLLMSVLPLAMAEIGATDMATISEQQTSLLMLKAVGAVFARVPFRSYTSPDGSRHLGVEEFAGIVLSHVTAYKGAEKPVAVSLEMFTGHPVDKYAVLAEALKVNYAGFFAGAASASPPDAAAAASSQ